MRNWPAGWLKAVWPRLVVSHYILGTDAQIRGVGLGALVCCLTGVLQKDAYLVARVSFQ